MPEHYEVTITIRDKTEETSRHYELASTKATPTEVADEVQGKLTNGYGNSLRPISEDR